MSNNTATLNLLNKYNVSVPRYTSYPTAPEWNEELPHNDYLNNIKTLDLEDGIALYIHVPFCEKLCWYCGCNTIIKKQKSHSEKYLKYLMQEIDQIYSILQKRIPVKQLHWGGGSPNFLTTRQTIFLLDKLDECFEIDYSGEIAIEIDPRTTENEQVDLYRKLGFNRISMGIQSFDFDVQKAINRIQPFERIEELVKLCRKLKYESINFDLIYGLPKQNISSFRETVEKTIELNPDRIALYSFAWLPDKIHHMKLIQEKDLPSIDQKFELFLLARELLTQGPYTNIAMDHFAKDTDQLSKAYQEGELHRNFMGYTVQEPRYSLGFGLSAISYINNTYIQNKKNLDAYYSDIDNYKAPYNLSKKLNLDDCIRQWVINRLMCSLSVNFAEFKQKFNIDFPVYFTEELQRIVEFTQLDFVDISKEGIAILPQGTLFIRNICCLFDSYYATNTKGFSKAI